MRVIRRLIMLIICIALSIRLTACVTNITKDDALGAYDRALEFFSLAEITPSMLLEGERSFGNERYYGEYAAELNKKSGSETLFGGASIFTREITLKAHISGESGSAKIVINVGGEEFSPEPDGNGDITSTFTASGSTYVTVEYDEFTGWVTVETGEG